MMNKLQKRTTATAFSLLALTLSAALFAFGKVKPASVTTAAQSQSEKERSPRCTSRTIRDSYGFISEGTAAPPTVPASLAGPLVGVGTVRFDKGGRFTLTATRSVNGVIDAQPLTLEGNYTVNEDCALAMSFDIGFTFRAEIVEGGDEILFIETDPGTTFIVRAKRI